MKISNISEIYCVGCGKYLQTDIQINEVRTSIGPELWVFPCKNCSTKEAIDRCGVYPRDRKDKKE